MFYYIDDKGNYYALKEKNETLIVISKEAFEKHLKEILEAE